MKKLLAIFLKLGLLAVMLVSALAWLQYQSFNSTPLSIPAGGLVFTVKNGDNLKRVASELETIGVLAKARPFEIIARIKGKAHLIKAGEYQLEQGMSANQLLEHLVDGKSLQYHLTIPEGWSFAQMLAALRNSPQIRNTVLDESNEAIMAAIGEPNRHPEGQFFPDTYTFPRGMTDIEFLKRAYRKMQAVLQEEWEARSDRTPLKSAYEALILASIIEKETGVPEERPAIAGVFTRRLNKGMKLQTDPTVIYGMGERFDGNIRRKDLRTDTPYNTYVHKGLTPTPIALPGREAIHAALHPADGKTFYFVAKGDGSHQFSETLDQHNAAVRKYQLKGRK
ncbi:MAG: endolytic transglycosylase MltG [bacterium]